MLPNPNTSSLNQRIKSTRNIKKAADRNQGQARALQAQMVSGALATPTITGAMGAMPAVSTLATLPRYTPTPATTATTALVRPVMLDAGLNPSTAGRGPGRIENGGNPVTVTYKDGTQVTRDAQFTGGTGHRKLSTITRILNQGTDAERATLNKEEWKMLQDLEASNNAAGIGTGQAGANGGPPATPGGMAMSDAAAIEQAQAIVEQQRQAVESLRAQGEKNARNTMYSNRAVGASEFVRNRADAGQAAGAVGNGWNPGMVQQGRQRAREDFAAFDTSNTAQWDAAIARLRAEADAELAALNARVPGIAFDILRGTRTAVNSGV